VIRLATRSSPLAMAQARQVAARLRAAWPGLAVVLVTTEAAADKDLVTPLAAMGGVGVFAKEVQALVLAGRADAGVHSCKDLPTALPAGLVLAATPPRADPRDGLVGAASLAELPPGAVVGTSSPRRREQLRRLRPDLGFADLRGNVGTRLGKIHRGDAAATLMAMAGLRRLGLRVATPLDPWQELVPAPAQGAIAVDCRADDRATAVRLAAIDHRPTHLAIDLERAVLAGIGGGCSLPLGCLAARSGDSRWRLRTRLWTGERWFEADHTGAAGALAERTLTDWRGGGGQ
jgi:hydroxymethylbilane synthase